MRQNNDKDVHILNPRTCRNDASHGRKDSADEFHVDPGDGESSLHYPGGINLITQALKRENRSQLSSEGDLTT